MKIIPNGELEIRRSIEHLLEDEYIYICGYNESGEPLYHVTSKPINGKDFE